MDSERLHTMKERAESVQAVVSHVKDMSEVIRYTIDLMHKQEGSVLAAPGLSDHDQVFLWKECEAEAIQLLTSPLRNHLSEIHTSLTYADCGIAETGTLVLDSSSEDIRIATMLAETHIAVLSASQIYADAVSLEEELTILQKSPPRYMAFITGPSRTADIERVLTIGVHGPQELHILIMEETEK